MAATQTVPLNGGSYEYILQILKFPIESVVFKHHILEVPFTKLFLITKLRIFFPKPLYLKFKFTKHSVSLIVWTTSGTLELLMNWSTIEMLKLLNLRILTSSK